LLFPNFQDYFLHVSRRAFHVAHPPCEVQNPILHFLAVSIRNVEGFAERGNTRGPLHGNKLLPGFARQSDPEAARRRWSSRSRLDPGLLLCYLRANLLECHASLLDSLRPKRTWLAEQGEEKVFRTDVVVSQALGFFGGVIENPLRLTV
jgi:hypothetical protein